MEHFKWFIIFKNITCILNLIMIEQHREIFKEFPKLRKDMVGSSLWTSGYYTNTVGLYASKDTIKNYIKNQGSEEKNYKKIYEGQLKFDLQQDTPYPWVGEYFIFLLKSFVLKYKSSLENKEYR